MLSPDHFWAPKLDATEAGAAAAAAKPPCTPGASPGSCHSLCPFPLVSAFQVVVSMILCIALGISYQIFCVLL